MMNNLKSKEKAQAIIQWLRDYSKHSINSLLIDERRCIPPNVVLEFGNQGLFGLQIPEKYSGLGLPYQETIRVMQQLGAIDLTLATIISTHANGVYPLQHYGSETLKSRFLPTFATGREICAFGLTEKGAGSNPHAISTTVTTIDERHWQISGQKIWVDSGSWASLISVFAYLSKPQSKEKWLSAFAIPLNTPNVLIEEEALTLGLRGMVQNNVRFNNVIIGSEHWLGAPGEGMFIAQEALSVARLILAAKCVGTMKYCLQLMQRYSKKRAVSTGILLENPVIIDWLFEISSVVVSVENLIQWLAKRLDADKKNPYELYFIIKNIGAEWLWKTADITLQTLGGRGYMACNRVSQILRDARTMRISEGPTEPLTLTLGANILNSKKVMFDFIDQELENHQLAEELIETISAINQRCEKIKKSTPDQQTAAYWSYFLSGEIASYSILLAALEYSMTHEESDSLSLVHTWLSRKLSSLKTAALEKMPVENIFFNTNQLHALIESFTDDISPLEQTAPFANYELDPLLKIDNKLDFWQKQLSGSLPVLHISSDFPRTKERLTFTTQDFEIDDQLLMVVKKFSVKEGIDLQAFILMSFYLLLSRYTDHQKILFAFHSSPMQSIMPIKINVSTSASLFQVLHQVHDDLMMAKFHIQDDIFQLTEHLQKTLHFNLLEKMTVLLAFNEIPLSIALDHLELILLFREEDGRCQLKYPKQLFYPETMNRLIQHFKILISQLADFKHEGIDQLNFLTKNETHLLLNVFNDTAVAYPQDRCVHELFEHQVILHPTKPAVILHDSKLTYQELNQKAEKLAAYLQTKGVKSGSRIGLFFEHSFELIISLFGILKVGATYVPLDPFHPLQRIQFVLEDAKLEIILTHSELVKNLPSVKVNVIVLDAEANQITDSQYTHPKAMVKPSDTAYILYTSGSTGTPKGVRISHSALVNFLCSMQKDPGIKEQDIVLAHTNVAFDITGLEIYLPLIAGASVVLSPRHMTLDTQTLIRYIKQHKVNYIQATPALWQMLINAGWKGDSNSKLLTGGEALPSDLARELISRSPSVWNVYGPTEATIWCSVYRIPEGIEGITPIGKPIANTQFYILDRQKRMTPLGVPGELYIGGDCLTQGYWNRPDLNEGRFHYFYSGEQHLRLYRTGDLVKYLPDGNLIYLGRLDRQIKLRGFRIEPGEIEYHLRQFPGVEEAIVITRELNPEDIRLVAYLLTQIQLDEAACHEFLLQRLPIYMVPHIFVSLTELPLTPNGKIDYKALPHPEFTDKSNYIAPRTDLEQSVCEIFAETLNLPIEEVGVKDDFFRLGGNSITAIKFLNTLNNKIFRHEQIQLLDIFKDKTVEKLCDHFLTQHGNTIYEEGEI